MKHSLCHRRPLCANRLNEAGRHTNQKHLGRDPTAVGLSADNESMLAMRANLDILDHERMKHMYLEIHRYRDWQ